MSLTNLGEASDFRADSVGADTAGVSSVATRMTDAIETLRDTFNKINKEVQDVKSGWKGEANTKFEQKLMEWDDEARSVNAKLTLLQEAVNKSKDTISAADADNTF